MNKDVLSAVSFALLIGFSSDVYSEKLKFQVDATPRYRNVPKIGLNLGHWTTWGASQLPVNVLKNPGFEGNIDRTLVIVRDIDQFGFSDNETWTRRNDGFWTGANFYVLSGKAAGESGYVFDSHAKHESGYPYFFTLGSPPPLSPGDVVSLTRLDDHSNPAHWWYDKEQFPNQLRVDVTERRPGSPGLRSLVMQPLPGKKASISSYLDAISDRAGKLLPVSGKWRLSFWMRQTEPGSQLNVFFKRLNGQPPFVNQVITPSYKWQLFEYEFQAQDGGHPATLELNFTASGKSGKLLLDDVELGPAQPAQTSEFRIEAVNALKLIQPGYLRDWQGQLGDTLANRLAHPFARRSSRYRPGEDVGFFYGLNEFLALSKEVGAQPWLILPTTFNEKEFYDFGKHIQSKINQLGFSEVLLEFGNENWNPLFRPAGIMSAAAHGQAANRAFRAIKSGADNHSALRFVVNGQYVNPSAAIKMLDNAQEADILAVAPYFLNELSTDDETDPWPLLFTGKNFLEKEQQEVLNRKKELSVYEVNLHTTRGSAGPEFRDRVVTSAAAGAALAKRVINALNIGVIRQCVYQFAQYDTWTETFENDKRELTKLWGVVRDLGETARFRPTGLATAMLNQILPGNLHSVQPGMNHKEVTLMAVHNERGWNLAVVSESSTSKDLEVNFPGEASWIPKKILRLGYGYPEANNELKEQVKIIEHDLLIHNDDKNTVKFSMPPYGFAILNSSTKNID